MVENSISLFVAVFVRIWPQFGKELAPVSSKWRLFCLVTSQHLLRLGAWRILHHVRWEHPIGHGGEFEQPLQIPFGPVFGDEAVQTRLLFPE